MLVIRPVVSIGDIVRLMAFYVVVVAAPPLAARPVLKCHLSPGLAPAKTQRMDAITLFLITIVVV
jgi:hypothetical protein